MGIIEIILLAVALGVDCCVVSFCQGIFIKTKRVKSSLMLAITMGFFQGGMPIIGYIGGNAIREFVASFSHWLVFAIFFILGMKFILDAFQEKESDGCAIGYKAILAMGVATSIDAVVAGASLSFTDTPIMFPALIIGIVSFLMSLFGFWSGNSIKNFSSKYLEIAGGIILIGLALKALFV